MTKREAEAICGTLSTPSKMPGHGYGISARDCHTGGRLRAVVGSTCHGCYALKGRYLFANVTKAHAFRLASLVHPQWVDAMASLIERAEGPPRGSGYFRWHDSGDLQSVDHLARICQVAERTPGVRHWLPTREVRTVRDYLASGESIPDNLNVRISAHMVDHVPNRAPLGLPMSTVSTHVLPGAHSCPAPTQGNQCGDCRACWSPNVAHVDYHKH